MGFYRYNDVTPQQLRVIIMASQFEITLFDNDSNHVSLFASLRDNVFKTTDIPTLPNRNAALATIKQMTPPYGKVSVSGTEWRELSSSNKLKEFIENIL